MGIKNWTDSIICGLISVAFIVIATELAIQPNNIRINLISLPFFIISFIMAIGCIDLAPEKEVKE